MATGGSGAVFFLGTRAHYQVLNQPESTFDVENGNASTETIYQNPSVQELWPADQKRDDNERWGYCDQDVSVTEEKERSESMLRSRRRQSTTALCEAELFTNAYNRCSNLQKAASGFRSAGIYPLRPIELDSIEPYISQQTAHTAIDSTQNIDMNTQPSNNHPTDVQQSPDAHNHVDATAVAQVHSVEHLDVQASDTGPANSQSEDTSTHAVSLSDIVELPIISPKISKRNIRKRKSTILTSTPIKGQLEEKENRKRAKAKEIKKRTEKVPREGSQMKRLKRSDKKPLNAEAKRILKNFQNIRDFNEPIQNTKEIGEEENEDYFCIFCSEKYIHPPVEDWIMCHMCEKWAHENCTDGQSTSAGYKCDRCLTEEKERSESMLRSRRRQSTTALCEAEDMKPAQLNNVGNSGPTKGAKGRGTLLALLWSLARRKRRGAHDEIYLRHIDNVLTNTCTYRESCRCLECQSRYFECDDDSEDYDSDEDNYVPHYVVEAMEAQHQPEPETEDEDDEVFIDTVPGDNTSTDMLLDKKMSVSSDEPSTLTEQEEEDKLQLEVAAGTPVLLNYLLTHPITCSIQ